MTVLLEPVDALRSSPLRLLCCHLLLGVPQKQQPQASSGFSLGFGSIGRIGMRSSNGGSSSGANKAGVKAVPSKPPVVPSQLLGKMDAGDDDIPAFTSSALTTR